MQTIREFFELVCEYPWTTFCLVWCVVWLLTAIAEVIHGPKNTIIINNGKDDVKEYKD